MSTRIQQSQLINVHSYLESTCNQPSVDSHAKGTYRMATAQWPQPPALEIDPKKQYKATISTARGDIVIQLAPEHAPKTVNNFVFLARQGFYDGVLFHRVISNFMVQGGDPTGTGR